MTFYDGLLFFSLLTAILPIAWICLIPFKDKCKYPVWRINTEIILIGIAVVATGYVLYRRFHFDRNANTALFVALPFAFLYYRRIIAEDLQKLLFVFFLAIHVSSALTMVRAQVNLMADAIISDKGQADLFIEAFMILVRMIYYPLVVWFARNYIIPRLKRIEPGNMKELWIVPATFTFIAIVSYTYFAPQNPVMLLIIIYFPLNILSFIVYNIILNMMDNVTKNSRLKVDRLLLEHINRMQTQLIATVTHETMTPLAVLSGYAELIAAGMRGKGVDEQTAKDLDNISEEARRIAGLMDGLNKHTLPTDGRLAKTRVNLSELINGSARLYTPILQRVNTSLAVVLPEDLPDVYACANEITQVLFNLLQNSRNHTADGTVTITAETVGSGAAAGENDGKTVTVSVSDTGSGIAPDILPRIFERGVTGYAEGRGLGLAICEEIMKRNGGAIEIESEKGKGTAARFTLPVWIDGVIDE